MYPDTYDAYGSQDFPSPHQPWTRRQNGYSEWPQGRTLPKQSYGNGSVG